MRHTKRESRWLTQNIVRSVRAETVAFDPWSTHHVEAIIDGTVDPDAAVAEAIRRAKAGKL